MDYSTTYKPIKLAIAIMAYGGHITVNQALMWISLGSALRDGQGLKLVSVQHWDINPVDRARNMALGSAMAHGADWLLMIDADTFVSILGPGRALAYMIIDAAEAGFDAVVAPVMSRDPNSPHVMAYNIVEGRLSPLYTRLTEDKPPSLVPIDAASAAVMAINLHSVDDSMQFRFVAASGDLPGRSEDIEFCRQMRAAGKKIACDTRVVTGHMGRSQPIYSRQA